MCEDLGFVPANSSEAIFKLERFWRVFLFLYNALIGFFEFGQKCFTVEPIVQLWFHNLRVL